MCMMACTSDDLYEEKLAEEYKGIEKITIVMPQLDVEVSNSRTLFEMGEYPSHTLLWADKDVIGIYPESGDQVSFQIEGSGTSCTFDGGGWALKPSSSYTAYFPFNRAYYYEDKQSLPISMLGQKQVGNNNTDHLGAYDILIAKGKKPTSGSLTFNPERKVAFARMKLKAPKAATWKSITLESNASFATDAIMNLAVETPIVTSTKFSNSVTLELENVETTSQNPEIIAYMIFLPVDFTGKSLTVKLKDNEGNVYASKASIVNNRTNFEANGARWIEAEFAHKKTVYLSTEGTLSDYITDDEKYSITQLTISGRLNGTDIKFIREMIGRDVNGDVTDGKLSVLDIANCTIVHGGDIYLYESSMSGYASIYNTINARMFYKCTNLRKITLPTSVTHIYEEAFYGCSALSSVILPKNLSYIDNYTFRGCSSLPSICIRENVTYIGSGAFYDCNSLFWIEILSDIASFESSTFFNCSITDFFCFAVTPPALNDSPFVNSIEEDAILYVPLGCKTKYESSVWNTYFAEIKEMP